MTPKTNNTVVNKWFTSKETYLIWRAAWKQAYADLSREIRELKQTRKDKTVDPHGRSYAQGCAALKRVSAAYMLEVRKESKLEAQRQYAAACELRDASVNQLADLQRP